MNRELVSNMFLLRSYGMLLTYFFYFIFSQAHQTTQTPAATCSSPTAKTTSLELVD